VQGVDVDVVRGVISVTAKRRVDDVEFPVVCRHLVSPTSCHVQCAKFHTLPETHFQLV
jgi:hypothetical protein